MKRFAYIDALRGYAILMVIAVHAGQQVLDMPPAFKVLVDEGARGVQLFFVVSALTLCMSWQTRNDGAPAFYVRRLFRIAPMFWLAIVFFLWIDGVGPRFYAPDGIGVRHVLMTATFTHGLMPDTINSVVRGGWSIADEMLFYAVFPALFVWFGGMKPRAAFLAAVASLIVSVYLARAATRYGPRIFDIGPGLWLTFVYLSLLTQFPAFFAGMALFKLSDRRISTHAAKAGFGAAIALMLVIPFLGQPSAVIPLYIVAFAMLTFALMNWSTSPAINPVIVWIGKVSFSAYLIHFALLATLPYTGISLDGFNRGVSGFALCFCGLTAATVALSSLTYIAIERPMVRLGNRLIQRREQAVSDLATATN